MNMSTLCPFNRGQFVIFLAVLTSIDMSAFILMFFTQAPGCITGADFDTAIEIMCATVRARLEDPEDPETPQVREDPETLFDWELVM